MPNSIIKSYYLFAIIFTPSSVCIDVENEPHLLPVTNEIFNHRTANTENEARLDVKGEWFLEARSNVIFWYTSNAR